jgi:hypothetical protein
MATRQAMPCDLTRNFLNVISNTFAIELCSAVNLLQHGGCALFGWARETQSVHLTKGRRG